MADTVFIGKVAQSQNSFWFFQMRMFEIRAQGCENSKYPQKHAAPQEGPIVQ